jgi:hypothetical protein
MELRTNGEDITTHEIIIYDLPILVSRKYSQFYRQLILIFLLLFRIQTWNAPNSGKKMQLVGIGVT